MKPIADLLTPERIVDLDTVQKSDALRTLTRLIARFSAIPDADLLLQRIIEREALMSTGIGIGIAVPHTRLDGITDFVIALGRSKTGIEYDALDGKPVHLIFMIIAPEISRSEYLKLLARITVRLKDRTFYDAIMTADLPTDIYNLLARDA